LSDEFGERAIALKLADFLKGSTIRFNIALLINRGIG